MVETRPHILRWTPIGSSTIKQIPCRFHLGGERVFKNEDNTVVNQVGRIRVDRGSELPLVGQEIEVIGQFKGLVKDVYRGQLSYRIDV